MTKTVAIIGGSQEQTYRKIGKKLGCEVLFHNGKALCQGTRKEFGPIVKKADCVVILLGACGHKPMEVVKMLCKKYDKKIVFHQGFGASGAIALGVEAMSGAS